MNIDLASVQTVPRPLIAVIDGAQIDLDDEGAVNGVVRFDGRTFRERGKTHLAGTIQGEVALYCTRCAKPLTRHLEITFEDVFVDAAAETAEKEIEVAGPALDEQLVTGSSIDLTEIIREQILLDLPEQVLCKEDCKGLCPECGADRNLLDCECGKKDIDPRWAALKDLK
jgi:uncharacterized protein